MRKERGITLVALVITIVLLVILVGVTISVAINSGIITQTKNAAKGYSDAEKKEKVQLLLMEYNIAGGDLGTFLSKKLENGEIDGLEGMDENAKSYVIAMGEKRIGIWKDTQKILGITSKELYEEVQQLKENEDTTSESYTIHKYSFGSESGTITLWYYIESEVMTEEKKMACEMNGIYLLGDANRNYTIDEEDWTAIKRNAGRTVFKGFVARENEISDVNGDGLINQADTRAIKIMIDNNIKSYLNTIKEEFEASMENEGENRVNITTQEYEQVKQYIPSYTDRNYYFGIHRGNLICLPFRGMSSFKLSICEDRTIQIYLLGDMDDDLEVTSDDVEYLRDFAEGDTPDARELIQGDINADGQITSTDVNMLQQMIQENS